MVFINKKFALLLTLSLYCTNISAQKYIIKASLGEIDYQNPNEIFLTDVVGIINLVDKNNIMIKSELLASV